MGRYLGSWKLEDVVAVHVQTSSVTTGAATDGDSVPTWRMYEDATATPVTTGSFATLNAQAGFYVAQITLAAAIGYEKGKSYGLRVACTVGAVIGADVHSLQIEAEVDTNTQSATVLLSAGAITAGTITDGAFTSPKFGAGFITAGSFSGNAISGMAVTVGATAASAIATATQALPMTLGATAVAAVSAAVTANSIGPVTVSSTSRATLVDEIWDEPKAGHVTADTYGEYLDATISGIAAGDTTVGATAQAAIALAVWGATRAASSTAGTFGEGIASVQGNVTGSVASVTGAVTLGATSNAAIVAAVTAGSIGAVTIGATSNAALAAAVTAGSIGPVTVGATSRAAIVDDVWDEPKSGHTTADTYGDYLDSTTGAIKTDSAAIKLKTDLLFAGTGNSIAADIRYVNGVSVTGNGQSGTEWGPGA
jgi:hypothetical protein